MPVSLAFPSLVRAMPSVRLSVKRQQISSDLDPRLLDATLGVRNIECVRTHMPLRAESSPTNGKDHETTSEARPPHVLLGAGGARQKIKTQKILNVRETAPHTRHTHIFRGHVLPWNVCACVSDDLLVSRRSEG